MRRTNRYLVGWALCACLFLSGSLSFANEKYEKPEYWLSRGYVAVPSGSRKSILRESPPWKAHSLAWPVTFQDERHSLGNSMAEFQSYGDGPYYHGGCDLRVANHAEVRTPVAGRIEAGHYGYSNHPNGSSTKYWSPWPEEGDPVYFEVAVITDDGYRFEFHHMDEDALSPRILAILKQGSGKVQAGTVLGRVISWPTGDYNHTHYNIISPSWVQLNPEYYSPLIPDHRAPEVQAALASYQDGRVVSLSEAPLHGTPEYFALAAVDHQDRNVYDHPPVFASLRFTDGSSFRWDFRERLAEADGSFPPIWDFFVRSIEAPDGETYETDGGYGTGISVIRLPVPSGAHGPFVFTLGDEAGNQTRVEGQIGR